MRVRLKERGRSSDQGLSSGAGGVADTGSDYFSSDKHYASLARRIVAALRSHSGWVLVTGDPPANPHALTEAIENLSGVRYEVLIIPCGPELRPGNLVRTVTSGPSATAGTAVTSEPPSAALPRLILFDNVDRLSDMQIKEVCEGSLHFGQIPAAGVMLASPDFLSRLQRPALHFLKEQFDAHLRVQEAGDDEAISFLHNQLLVQRDRQIKARGFRRGFFMGLATSGGVLAAGIGLFIVLNPPAEKIIPTSDSTGQRGTISEERSLVVTHAAEVANPVSVQAAPKTETRSASATAPSPPVSSAVTESRVDPSVLPNPPADLYSAVSAGERRPISKEQSTVQPPQTAVKAETSSSSAPVPRVSTSLPESQPTRASSGSVDSPAGAQYSDAEIATLMRRGDAFLSSGDTTSARLFYERAADAGSGRAALQLGATFDPVILGRLGTLGVLADPAQALAWYLRQAALAHPKLSSESRVLKRDLLAGRIPKQTDVGGWLLQMLPLPFPGGPPGSASIAMASESGSFLRGD